MPPNFDVITWKQFTPPPAGQNFTTSSQSLVPSNLPTNPTFIKQLNDTLLWFICAVDIVPASFDVAFNFVAVDDVPQFGVSIAGPPNQLIVVNMTTFLSAFPAGSHTIKFYVATNGTSCTWRTPAGLFFILEVTMPPMQA